jgi:ribonuclease HI
MIDSGASSLVIPKCVVGILEMKYELIVRDVLQLDGSTVKTIGILRNVEKALHACPGCTIIQDMSIFEVKPHFSICLSRDFTAQIGGYISFDWSYMFFRTRYGTKASIREEPLSLHRIELYTPSLIKMNYTILEIDENDKENEPTTSLVEILDFLLDAWANSY